MLLIIIWKAVVRERHKKDIIIAFEYPLHTHHPKYGDGLGEEDASNIYLSQ